MRVRFPALLVMLALAALAARPAGAQVVRGVVTERASGERLSGVLVTLERPATGAAEPQVLANTLTNETGEYSMRAPAAGRYVVSAKRIGVRRYSSEAFTIAAGETRRIDVMLDAVLYTLPPVVVSSGSSLCLLRGADAERIASLWDEARTALRATQISLRDRLFKGRISRYSRELDPRNLRVISETRSDMQGFLDKPFSALSGDSLSKIGYWRELKDGSTVYSAPDGDVLMSSAFLHDHCYWAVNGGRDRRGLVGIAFEPNTAHYPPDVRGTIWLDGKTFELRLVEFRYTKLQTSGDSTKVGGEVHFARLKSGAWVVRRWFIRMPQFAHYVDAPVGVDPRMPSVLVRPGIYRFIEEGGDVYAEGIRMFEKPAAIAGVVMDSTGAPLRGAVVRLAGTPFTVTADSTGAFHLDSLPAGSHTLIAEYPSYEALGMSAGDLSVSLTEGETERVSLRASDTGEIVSRLCDGKPPVKRKATLRLTVLDSDNGTPLASLPVWVHWAAAPTLGDDVRFPGIQSRTDAKGIVTFCELPGGTPIDIELLRSDERPVHITELTLRPDEVAPRTIKAKRPK